MMIWKHDATIPASKIAPGMWITTGKPIGPDDYPRKVKSACPFRLGYFQVVWDEEPVSHRNIHEDEVVNTWVPDSPYRTTSPYEDPVAFQCLLALDVLDDNAAAFHLAPLPASAPLAPNELPQFVLSREQWEAMGRPGFIEVAAKGAER